MDLPKYSPVLENLKDIEHSAKRAAELTNQMLAYSGKGRFVIQTINMTKLIEEMIHLVKSSVSKKAEIRLNLIEDLSLIEGDINQLRQVVMNMITNASEALGDEPGIIGISNGMIECDRKYLDDFYFHEELTPGEYILIEFKDTGCGMDEDTISKIFDPFFTTKFTGRGLGLAAVLGIIRGHHGAIRVVSEPNIGTTFTILFPCTEMIVQKKVIEAEDLVKEWEGEGTILLVDDEVSVRRIAQRMLERIGFNVIPAHDGMEAVEIFKEKKDEINAVLLDMKMPRMDGPQAFIEIRKIKRDAMVILSSGFTETEAESFFQGDAPIAFIQKPYSFDSIKSVFYEIFNKL